MCKMNKYKSLKRTTLDNMDDLPHYGVYIIAYMGRVLYVGKANDSVVGRLKSHLYKCDVEDVGGWMFKVRDDWHNVRLDVLEPPDEGDVDVWLKGAEAACVRQFNPLFNTMLMA